MNVWIYINGEQEGPYDIQELPLDIINESTPVWYQGLRDWLPAGEAPLTAKILAERSQSAEAAIADEQPQQAEPQEAEEPQQQEPSMDFAPQQWTQPQYAYAPSQPAMAYQMPSKCPMSLIFWSAMLILLSFNLFAVVPLCTGIFTRYSFRNQQYERAERLSTITQWLFAIALVLSLIYMPFGLIMLISAAA